MKGERKAGEKVDEGRQREGQCKLLSVVQNEASVC